MSSGAALQASANKTKDGVPLWDGDPSSFQEFSESARLYEQSIAFHKRSTVGPRIASELTGAARRQLVGLPADWLSFSGGVERLLDHLRQGLGQPKIVEVTEHLGKYFKLSKRRSGESINDYVTRKNEIYLRAQQAMARVQPVYQEPVSRTPATTWANWGSRRSSYDSQATADDDDAVAPSTEATTTATTATREDPWWQSSWSWNGSYYSEPTWNEWGSSWSWRRPESWNESGYSRAPPKLPELLPDFVQGWMLLQDAGLDNTEKSLVQATIGENYTMKSVTQALRTYFSDAELRKRDHGRRQHGFLGDYANDEEDDEGEAQDLNFVANEMLTDEGYAAWSAAQTEVDEAMAAIQHGRRTLRDARARQHSVKMSRQYFRGPSGSSSSSTPSTSRPRESPGIICLKCGRPGHKAVDCPQQPKANMAEEQSAAFTFYAEPMQDDPCEALSASPSTSDAVQQGKAVIDSGATRSIGSVQALERIMMLNYQRCGEARVSDVNHDDRPVFGFGNSSSDQCVSTVTLRISAGGKPGAFKVHALDKGCGPVLMSIEALRALGAIVDYEKDLMVLRRVDARRLLQLERLLDVYSSTPWFQTIMSGLTRKELQAKLEEQGESVPSGWTKVEMLLRIEELTGINQASTVPAKTEKSDYQELVQNLNKASRKKSELQAFCAAMIQIYTKKTVPEPTDVMGFGCHSKLKYSEVKANYPEHCTWVVTTAREGQCDPRLRRFAGWLENNVDQVNRAKEELEARFTESEKRVEPAPKKAAPKKKMMGYSSSSSSQVEDDSVTLSGQQLRSLVETIEGLKEEVASLKEERPRKKA
ncbi:unnamed protein product [Symbiodinium microadriaticum]|nr:unnamed protein product [Symbiodinium microadriaticum]